MFDMKDGKFNVGIYILGVTGGFLAGSLFSKAFYHKGKADAYADCASQLQTVIDETETILAKKKEEEGS